MMPTTATEKQGEADRRDCPRAFAAADGNDVFLPPVTAMFIPAAAAACSAKKACCAGKQYGAEILDSFKGTYAMSYIVDDVDKQNKGAYLVATLFNKIPEAFKYALYMENWAELRGELSEYKAQDNPCPAKAAGRDWLIAERLVPSRVSMEMGARFASKVVKAYEAQNKGSLEREFRVLDAEWMQQALISRAAAKSGF